MFSYVIGRARAIEAGVDLPAGASRLGNLDHDRARGENVPDMYITLGDASAAQVFAEHAGFERALDLR